MSIVAPPRKSFDDVRLDFLMNVYDSISRQIQAMDLKISILLSWNGVVAVMGSRELSMILKFKEGHSGSVWLLVVVALCLGLSSYYTWGVLKPRIGRIPDTFAGLLFSGDILQLGKNPAERMAGYLKHLQSVEDHDHLYQQFSKSIVLISEIHVTKNRLFNKGISATALAFLILVILFALRGLRVAA